MHTCKHPLIPTFLVIPLFMLAMSACNFPTPTPKPSPTPKLTEPVQK